MVEKGKLYYETFCDHGLWKPHDWYTSAPLTPDDPVSRPWFDGDCPGGTRTEVTIDIGAVAALLRRSGVSSIPHLRKFAESVIEAALVEGQGET